MTITGEAGQTSPITTKPVLIELSGVHKVYRIGPLEYPALRGGGADASALSSSSSSCCRR